MNMYERIIGPREYYYLFCDSGYYERDLNEPLDE